MRGRSKKFLQTALSALVAFGMVSVSCFSAADAGSLILSSDFSGNSITVNYTAQKDDKLMIELHRGEVSLESVWNENSMAANVTVNNLTSGQSQVMNAAQNFDFSQLVYLNDARINADGIFEKQLDPGKTGVYSLAIKNITNNQASKEVLNIWFTTSTDYKKGIDALKAAPDMATALEEEIKCNGDADNFKLKTVIGFTSGLDSAVELSDVVSLIDKAALLAEGEGVYEQNREEFLEAQTIVALNKSASDNVVPYIDGLIERINFGKNTDNSDKIDAYLDTETEGNVFTAKLSGKNLADTHALETAAKRQVALMVAANPVNQADIKAALTAYASELGLSSELPLSSNSLVYANLVGEYSDYNALVSKYKALAKEYGAGSGNNGGNGGGGAGGSGGAAGGATKPMGTGSGDVAIDITNQPVQPLKSVFRDIDQVVWASEAIIGLADMNIINGKGDGIFAPNDNITREEFAKILVGALKFDEGDYKINSFSDADENEWYCKYINIAKDKGIIKGVSDDCFGVGENITRQDMVVMIHRALLYKDAELPEGELEFEDSSLVADYATDAVASLCELGVINGVSETSFQPMGLATRAQAAKVIYGVIGLLRP